MINAVKTTFLVLILLLVFQIEPFHFTLEPLFIGLALGLMNFKVSRLHPIFCIIITIGFGYLALYSGLTLLYIFDLFSEYLKPLPLDVEVLLIGSGLLASIVYYLLLRKIYYNLNVWKGVKTIVLSYCLVPVLVFGAPQIIPQWKSLDFLPFFTSTWLLSVSFFMALVLNNIYIFEKNTYRKAIN